MEADEISPVEGHQDAVGLPGVGQDIVIRYSLPCIASLLHCQCIMAHYPQMLYHFERKVFIDVQTSHASSLFVLANSLVDLIQVCRHIGPGVAQISRS